MGKQLASRLHRRHPEETLETRPPSELPDQHVPAMRGEARNGLASRAAVQGVL